MKKMLVPAFTLAMLSSSVAFADASKLSAFEGVETSVASTAELNQVSGEGLVDFVAGLVLGDVGGLVTTLLGDVTGLLSGLGLLNGLTVESSTDINLGDNVVSGLLGLNTINLGLNVQ